MGLYDDIPPPGAGGVVEKEATAAAEPESQKDSLDQSQSSEKSDTVTHTLYGGLNVTEESEAAQNEKESSEASTQPQRLNLSFLSKAKASKGRAPIAVERRRRQQQQHQQQQQQEPEKPSLVPPSLKRPRPTHASAGAPKRQKSGEGVRVIPMARPAVHKVSTVPLVAQRSAEVRVEDEYDPFHPNTYAEYLKERQRRAAMVLQEEHDKAALLALARNIESSEGVGMEEASTGGAELDHEGDTAMAEAMGEAKAPKEKFAERMMKKMGWEEGKGLGRDGLGMVKPLEAKRTAVGSGLIVDPAAEENAAKNAADSPVLLLENMVESMAVADTELQEEVKEECERIGGAVDQILVTADMKNNARIFVVFKEPSAAKKVLQNFNGRFFAGRQVSARQYSKRQFERRQYIL